MAITVFLLVLLVCGAFGQSCPSCCSRSAECTPCGSGIHCYDQAVICYDFCLADICDNNEAWVPGCQSSFCPAFETCKPALGACESFSSSPANAYLDPHFTGLNGHKYDFQGEPGKVFALISDRNVQVNARFVRYNGETVMGDVCIRFCDSTVTLSANIVTEAGPRTENLAIAKQKGNWTSVTAGLWTLKVEPYVRNGSEFHNLQDVVLHNTLLASPVHGVLGVTAPASPLQALNVTLLQPKPSHCQARHEGGCEVPGKWPEYEVEDGDTDLCSTRFKYSKFSPASCMALSTSKRGAHRSLLQKAEAYILP